MRITKFKISNYKSFIESNEITFDSGFNVVVGQNNVGKTALLEGLSLSFPAKPHLSVKTKPDNIASLDGVSTVQFSIFMSGEELYRILTEEPGKYSFPIVNSKKDIDGKSLEEYVYDFLELGAIEFMFVKNSNQNEWKVQKNPSTPLNESCDYSVRAVLAAGNIKFHAFSKHQLNQIPDLGLSIFKRLNKKIYCFRAERMNIASSQGGVSTD